MGKLRADCAVATSATSYRVRAKLQVGIVFFYCVWQSNDNITEGKKWIVLV